MYCVPQECGMCNRLSVCSDDIVLVVREVDEAGLERFQNTLDKLNGLCGGPMIYNHLVQIFLLVPSRYINAGRTDQRLAEW